SMPGFSVSPDHSLARLKAIQETQRSFGLEVVEALLDGLEAKDRRLNEILTPNMLLPVIDDMDADNLRQVIKTASENYSLLHAKWEASEKRIAELEAREVKLPEHYDIEIFPTPSPHGEWYSCEDVLAALKAAGIKFVAGTGNMLKE
ncbi:hypothetical protein ABK774_22475, partial [Enterobacter hormaechei]